MAGEESGQSSERAAVRHLIMQSDLYGLSLFYSRLFLFLSARLFIRLFPIYYFKNG